MRKFVGKAFGGVVNWQRFARGKIVDIKAEKRIGSKPIWAEAWFGGVVGGVILRIDWLQKYEQSSIQRLGGDFGGECHFKGWRGSCAVGRGHADDQCRRKQSGHPRQTFRAKNGAF